MRISGRIGTKVLAALLCQCMVLSMLSVNVHAATVDDNPTGTVVENINFSDVMDKNNGTVDFNNGTVNNNIGTVNYNNGTVNYNNGTVNSNKGAVVNNLSIATVQENEGSVNSNSGTVFNNYGIVRENLESDSVHSIVSNNYGTVLENYGTVERNFGTVENKTGTVKEEFRKIDIVGSNYNLKGDLVTENNSSWAVIKAGNEIMLIANAGYHFAIVPTANAGTITQSGNDYKISEIPDDPSPLVITLSIVKDPDQTPDSTPTSDDNNDNHHDTKKTVETLSKYEIYMQTQIAKMKSAKAGDTVVIESDSYHSYSLTFMKELLARRDVAVRLSYNYMGMHYEVFIPQNYKFILDDNVPWYGPLKIAVMFGAVITPIEK